MKGRQIDFQGKTIEFSGETEGGGKRQNQPEKTGASKVF